MMTLAQLHTRLDAIEAQLEASMEQERKDSQRRMDALRLMKSHVNTIRVSLAINRRDVQPPAFDEGQKFGGPL